MDLRDCRLGFFRLGDASVPDDISWPTELRDESCVWLDYVDATMSKCRVNYIKPRNTTNLTADASSTRVSVDIYPTIITANRNPSEVSIGRCGNTSVTANATTTQVSTATTNAFVNSVTTIVGTRRAR